MASAAEARGDMPPVGRGDRDHAPVDLGGRVEIMPGAALPDLDSPGGQAYSARGIRDRRTEMFAIVCDGPVPARIEAMTPWRGIDHPAVLKLVDWGTVDWTPEGRRRFVVVLERPGGRRLMDSLADVRDPIPEDVIIRAFMPALLSGLRDIAGRGISAGAIRPTNLFVREGSGNAVALGDCLSVPAGYGQPLLLEPVERAMAQPSGRGGGTAADDLYALGVSLLLLHLGRNPLRGMDDESVLRLKMDKGTYPALTNQLRMPQNLIEPLRGLMTDDTRQRWTLSDLDMWLQGRRLSPKQPQVPRRGGRPLEFQGEELWHCRAIARAISRNTPAAAAMIAKGDLDKWLRRSLADDERADLVEEAIASAGAGAGNRTATQEDRMVARVGIALDPTGPIRYRGIAVLPDGLGPALAEAMWAGENIQPLAETVLFQLPMFWVSCQPDFRPEYVPLVQNFDLLRTWLENPGLGYGIERVLYETCPACPCLSPQLRDQYPLTLGELLAGLDAVGRSHGRGREPMDRHIAAFITTHHKKVSDRLVGALGGGGQEPGRHALAVLHVLADVQRRFGPAHLPGLAGWLLGTLEPALERFKNRETREKLMAQAEKLVAEGSLDALVRLLDDPEALREDEKGFAQALRRYDGLSKQIDKLRRAIADQGGVAHHNGRQVAAVISSVLAMMVLVGTVVVMTGGI